ncbi:MAG: PmoA family protein [Candidatus Hydrogenedentes bacterium]|nr:PmoA family protein [Candidatus Hydrogenedentota bacterium]
MRLDRRSFLTATTAALTASCATRSTAERSAFGLSNDGKRVTVLDRGSPVFVYNYAPVDPPAGVDARFRRANYIHPLYSPDGAIVTEDFPKDHYHHRGVFWAWPNCRVGRRKLNVWELETGRSVFETWAELAVARNEVRLEEHSLWKFDDGGTAPIDERVSIVVRPESNRQRAIDFALTFKNVAETDATFQGSDASAGAAGTGAKGYGGFCFRPDANNKPFVFTARDGVIPEDRMAHETTWVDISWGTKEKRGVAIVQHPSNPGYPHRGWMIRHYGFLGASWPHNDPHTLKPGESFTLRYRLIVHEGDAVEAGIGNVAESLAGKPDW